MEESSHPEPAVVQDTSLSSGCPWLNKKSNPIVDPVNPLNNMPALPQSAALGQKSVLSTEREVSSIPKTGTNEARWEYPSPQQFYHALLRRNKEADEATMDSVVYVHNNVNEESWEQIMRYESMHASSCKNPSLQRFVGNSEKISPKAWIVSKFSREELFDRHDWFVDRCGVKTQRYIIDYYDTTDTPNADDKFNVRIDARPALDDLGSVWDRIRFPIMQWIRPAPPAGESDATSGYVAG